MFRLTVLCAADWITPALRASLPAEFGRARQRGTGAAARAALLGTHTHTNCTCHILFLSPIRLFFLNNPFNNKTKNPFSDNYRSGASSTGSGEAWLLALLQRVFNQCISEPYQPACSMK